MRSLLASFSSSTSANRARACSIGWRRRTSCAAIEAASGPLRRTMPMPPRPGGVEIATMVSTIAAVTSGTLASVVITVLILWNRGDLTLVQADLLDLANVAQADEQRRGSNHAKAAVDHAPVKRNPPDGSRNQCQRQHSQARNQAKRQHPFVAHRIA